jgi:ferredoxin
VTIQISIDLERCCGAGECAMRAPGTFSVAEEGQAVVHPGADEPESQVLAAARSCPHFAIVVKRDSARIV